MPSCVDRLIAVAESDADDDAPIGDKLSHGDARSIWARLNYRFERDEALEAALSAASESFSKHFETVESLLHAWLGRDPDRLEEALRDHRELTKPTTIKELLELPRDE